MQNAVHKKELLNHPPKPLALSKDPRKAVHQMMAVIDTVKDVYIRETDALKRLDVKTFHAMQEEKMMAALSYQSGVQQMMQRREEIRKAAPDIRMELEEKHAEFTVLLDKNMKAIARAKHTMGRLMERIKEAAQDSVEKDYALSYGETGSMAKRKKQPLTTGISEQA